MAAVIPTNSVLLDLNSRFAVPDVTLGNGKYTCVVNNANKVNSCIKIMPHRISIPNIFPNIRSNSSLTFFLIANFENRRIELKKVDITEGFYTLTDLLATLNTPDSSLSVALTDTGKLQLKLTIPASGGGDPNSTTQDRVFIEGENETLFSLLGFQTQRGTKTTIEMKFFRGESTLEWSVVAPNIPNMGGEKLVHVSLRPISQGNLVSSNGYEYDILTTVPLHTTKYGDYAVQSAPDLFTDDTDFPRQLTAASAEVELLDAYYEPLHVPTNYHVNVQLKCYHLDSAYSSSM